MAKMVNIKNGGVIAEVTLPKSPWIVKNVGLKEVGRVVDLFTKARHAAWKAGYLQMSTRVRKYGMTFIVGLHLVLNTREPLTIKAGEPVTFQISLSRLGNSSFDTSSVLKNGNEVGASCDLSWIHVDRETRKPKVLPDWMKTQFASMTKTSHPITTEPLMLPSNAIKSLVTVSKEHIDKFGHTNHECYLDFCTEAIKERSDQFPHQKDTTKSLFRPSVKELRLLYAGESYDGDALEVYTWTDKLDSTWNYCQIVKNSKPIVHCSINMENNVYSKL